MYLEQRLDQRLELEIKLEQKLQLNQKHELTLCQYLEHEDFFKGLVRWVDNHNRWREFNKDGFNFIYADIPYKQAPHIIDNYGLGFAHCWFNSFDSLFFGNTIALAKGNWTLFVASEMIPENLVDLVAIHERGEELSLGNHFFASKLEIAYAQHKHKLREHISFIDDICPSKFADFFQEVNFPILPIELVEYLKSQNTNESIKDSERTKAEKIIEKYHLPISILKKIDLYLSASEDLANLLKSSIGPLQKQLHDNLKSNFTYPESSIEIVNNSLYNIFSKVNRKYFNGLSNNVIIPEYESFVKLIGEWFYPNFKRHIAFPDDYKQAFQDFNQGKKLAIIETKVEDIVKDING